MTSRGLVAARRRARPVALALFGFTLATLLVTNQAGYTRDESFYFRYARSYAGWFHEVAAAEGREATTSAFSRSTVVKTWIGNFEHPPLLKSLFGLAWRAFAYKDRRMVLTVADESAGQEVSVVELESTDGFDLGTTVQLLRAQRIDEQADSPQRRLGSGRVAQRAGDRATIAVTSDVYATVKSACQRQGAVTMGPCQVRDASGMKYFDEVTAMRMVAFVLSGLAVSLTFLLGVELVGFWAGLFGALGFLFIPRYFFHAHLIAFDMGIVTAMLATLYAFWRSLEDRRWALAAGVAWGLSLLTKHNAFFLPVPLVVYWLWQGKHELSLRGLSLRLPSLPLSFLVMPPVALTMLFVFWPKLWYDPFVALTDYFQFHLAHDHYMQWYFGAPLEVPPFPISFPFVLTLFTLPEVLSLLMCAGAVLWWRAAKRGHDPQGAGLFLALNGLAPIFLIALPSTPIFGGVKHWMTGMPLLMLFGGYALSRLIEALSAQVTGRLARPLMATVIVASVFAGPVSASIRHVSFGTGYYNALIADGIRGAADRKMMRLYWGHTSLQAMRWLNRHAPRGARVYFQNTTRDAFEMYRRVGLLRHDIRYVRGVAPSQIALIEPQKAFAEIDLEVRQRYAVAGPVAVVRHDGVPMLRVYQRVGLPTP